MPFHQQAALESPSPFKPAIICPNCGAKPPVWKVGCQYQDCNECEDVESSHCARCHCGVGGASYWR